MLASLLCGGVHAWESNTPHRWSRASQSTVPIGPCVLRLGQGKAPNILFGLVPGIAGFAASRALRLTLPLGSGGGLRSWRKRRIQAKQENLACRLPRGGSRPYYEGADPPLVRKPIMLQGLHPSAY